MKTEYAQEVAARIIEQLEQGTAPWQKPWKPGELSLPYNPVTGKEYRGMNSLWLYAQGHSDPRWMTYNQAQSEGAQVKKGVKGSHIVYWKFTEEKNVTDEQGKPILDENGTPKKMLIKLERPRSFTAVVFNGSQIDGLSPLEEKKVNHGPHTHARAEAILANSGAQIQHIAGNKAFYRLTTDEITLPERSQFETADAYYATALHELGHWTGHPSRLDRDLSHPFGSQAYAREELRAEIASLMLGERLDIGHDPSQHAAYVGSWIKALKEDPKEIFRAAADAERISAYLMEFELEQNLIHENQAVSVQTEQQDTGNTASVVVFIRHELENPMPSRAYLAVPYAEKDEAKKCGAKWDKAAKSWYAPEGIDLTSSGLERWSPDNPNVMNNKSIESVESMFAKALRELGLKLDGEPVMNGQLQRVPVEGDKPSQKSGAYVGHLTGQTPGGYIENYKSGEIRHWKPEGKLEELSPETREKLRQEAHALKAERTKATEEKYENTARAAQILWREATPASSDNPYCQLKGIENPLGIKVVPSTVSAQAHAEGIRIAKTASQAKDLREQDPTHRVFKEGDLLIPGMDEQGKIWTLQSVNPYFKSLMKGGRKHGLFNGAGTDNIQKFLEESDPKSPIIFAEGYATADTVSRLNHSIPVVMVFDSGNLDAVLERLRERFPTRPFLIAADNDHLATQALDVNGNPKRNVGLTKATDAAEKFGCGVMCPQFKDTEKGSDWNDLAGNLGDELARKMFKEQLALAKREAAINADQLMSLARTREMDARNDPTTSVDDVSVANERGHAQEVMITASSQLSEVRNLANDGLTGNLKGTRSLSSIKAGLDRKTESMHDKVKQEREQVFNHPHLAKQEKTDDASRAREHAPLNDADTSSKKVAPARSIGQKKSRNRDLDLDL